MRKCTLVIEDEVNIQFLGIEPDVRRELIKAVEFEVPGARFTPAVRLGRWNGKISYFSLANRSYLNIIDKLIPILEQYNYDIDIDDRRIPVQFNFDKITAETYAHFTWPEGHQLAGKNIEVKPHQLETINNSLENIQGVSIVPTGGGKSIVTGILAHQCQTYGRTILIVPSKDLVTQTEEDYRNLGLDVGVYFGDRKEYGNTHIICTWQSLEVLNKHTKGQTADITIEEFLDGVVCVIVDEVHRGKGNILRTLLSGPLKNIPIRWGLTGTLPEDDGDKMAITCCIGPLLGKVEISDLQDKGILAKLQIHIHQLKDLGESFPSYPSELKWLTTNKRRIEFLAGEFAELSKSGNTLILVDRIETGKMLQQLIPDSVFVDGSMKSKDRKAEYKEVATVDEKVIIASFGVASTGVNIVRIFNLVLFEPGKAYTKIIQSIGRGIRVAEDKDFLNVYDICSDSKYSKRHLTKRKAHYKEAGYPYKVTKIEY
jgi:superfamily II DNA or RNA helicase